MSPTDRDRLREAIRRTLAARAGSAPGSRAVAAAAVGTWNEMAARLAPVIGERGVEALFSRALHLATAAHPWLGVERESGGGGTPLAVFSSRIEAREAGPAAEASEAVLMTFTELLASLIGSSLSERLLAPVWVLEGTAERKASP